jgi:hypothetical protein
LKSSFYPLFNPITSPGTNPKPAAIGDPEVTIVEEWVANCDAVLLSASTTCPSTLDNVVIVAFSTSNRFTYIHPLYDRYANPATNNPATTTAPNRRKLLLQTGILHQQKKENLRLANQNTLCSLTICDSFGRIWNIWER